MHIIVWVSRLHDLVYSFWSTSSSSLYYLFPSIQMYLFSIKKILTSQWLFISLIILFSVVCLSKTQPRVVMMLMQFLIKLDNWGLYKGHWRIFSRLRAQEASQGQEGCSQARLYQLLRSSLSLWCTTLFSGEMVSPSMMALWGAWMIPKMLLFLR